MERAGPTRSAGGTMKTKKTLALLSLGLGSLLLAGCGGSTTMNSPSSAAPGFYITISNMTFAPLELAVPPGATVTVLNRDATTHSVTSEAAAGEFKPGAVAGIAFDTKPFTGTATFTIPPSAAEGTVI